MEKENLRREIGVRSLTLAIINATVGSGIFLLPAIVAENLGPSAIIAYLVCGALIFLVALCFAELGSRVSTSGGTYTYIETAFGDYAGFLANNIYWFGASVLSDAALANALSDTLSNFFPSLKSEFFRACFFLFVFGGLALLNIRSVKYGIRFIEFTALGKLIPLLLFVIFGAGFVSTENLSWISTPTINNIGATSVLLFFAFMGMETPLSNGGEIKNAKRTVPLGIFFGIASVLVLYIGIQLIVQGVLGTSISLYASAPLAGVAGIAFGKAGMVLIIITTGISILGGLGGEILSVPRILYAGARDGLMPKVLAKVHPKYFTPYVAVIVYSALGFLFAVLGGFRQLAIISSASSLLIYLGTALATLKLRNSDLAGAEKSFRIPGGKLIPALAVLVILWLLSNLSRQELMGISVFIFIFSLIYMIVKRIKVTE